MSVCSQDLLSLGEQLASQSNECSHRAAISRSYYAVFHGANLLADHLNLDKSGSNSGVHEKLITRFERASKRLSVFARALRKQKMCRVRCDYDLSDEVAQSEALQSVASCRLLLDEFERLRLRTTA